MIKEEIVARAGKVTDEMVRRDPFHALTMIIIVLLLAWYAWQNHSLKEELVEIMLTEQDQERARGDRFERFEKVLKDMQKQNFEDRDLFLTMLERMENRDRQAYESLRKKLDRFDAGGLSRPIIRQPKGGS